MSHHGKNGGEGEEGESSKVCVLFSTCPRAEADRLARFLVEGNHAACVNILPHAKSIYRWEGKVQEDDEALLVIKCARDRSREVTEALVKEHPYDVPEVIVLKVKGGNAAYLDWVVKGSKGP